MAKRQKRGHAPDYRGGRGRAQGLALQSLEADGRITGLQLIDVAIYGAAAASLDPDHAADRALIALFRAA